MNRPEMKRKCKTALITDQEAESGDGARELEEQVVEVQRSRLPEWHEDKDILGRASVFRGR
jgi:hypothetical protein